MKEIQSYFTEKNILTIFFPGLLATYPLLLLGIHELRANVSELQKFHELFTPLSYMFYILMFIGIYGIGFLIKRMAIRTLELRLDTCVEKEVLKQEEKIKALVEEWKLYRLTDMDPKEIGNKLIEIITEENKQTTFAKRWYDYLQKRFGVENRPLIIEYYNAYIHAYHFELTCIIAIICQLVLMFWLDGRYYHLFSNEAKCGITVFSAVLIWVFYNHSLDSAREADQMRGYIVNLKECDKEADEPTDSSSTN